MTDFFSKSMNAVERVRVRSALNPILWLCAFFSAPVVLYQSTQASQAVTLVVLAYIPVVVAMFGFLYLLFWDRDKLQSEDFQIRKHSLEMLQQQKGDQAIPLDHLKAVLIQNPQFHIEHRKEVSE